MAKPKFLKGPHELNDLTNFPYSQGKISSSQSKTTVTEEVAVTNIRKWNKKATIEGTMLTPKTMKEQKTARGIDNKETVR